MATLKFANWYGKEKAQRQVMNLEIGPTMTQVWMRFEVKDPTKMNVFF